MDDLGTFAAIAFAVICIGLAKGGIAGLVMLAVPVLALVMSPLRAAGFMLPFLMLGDVIAIRAYWGVFDRQILRVLVPAGAVGIGLGWLIAGWVNDDVIRLGVGLMSLAFPLGYWFGRGGAQSAAARDPRKGFVWGVVCGITSFFANVGGPPFQVYVAPLRLDRRVFTGTAVLFFAIINVIKLGPFILLGQITWDNLTITAMLLPLAVGATYVGVWAVRRMNDLIFYRLIYVSVFLIGLKLTYDGATAIWL